jgi:hypothetical protein
MEITNYITTDFKAIDSQDYCVLKTFDDLTFHTFLLLKKAFTLVVSHLKTLKL